MVHKIGRETWYLEMRVAGTECCQGAFSHLSSNTTLIFLLKSGKGDQPFVSSQLCHQRVSPSLAKTFLRTNVSHHSIGYVSTPGAKVCQGTSISSPHLSHMAGWEGSSFSQKGGFPPINRKGREAEWTKRDWGSEVG